MTIANDVADGPSGPWAPGGPSHGDEEMFAALGRLLSPGGFVVDVGANDGQFMLTLRRSVGVRGVSLEPGSAAFARLQQSINGIDDLKALNVAASSTTGSADFYVSSSDVGSSLLRPIPGSSSQWATTVAVEQVSTVRLDELAISERWSQIDLLKIDTQGSDLDVLASAGAWLNGTLIGAVLVEVNFHDFYVGQDSFGEICLYMEMRGYFLGELFRRYNHHGWLWYADALFLPKNSRFTT